MSPPAPHPLVRQAPERLRAQVQDKLLQLEDPWAAEHVQHLRSRYGDALAGVIFYGSCLFAQTRTPTSFYDFYLLTDEPRRFHGSLWHSALNAVLPPNVYYGRVARGERDDLRYKACVISLRQYIQQTSPRADDIHHLGRFSKRFALAHARDEQVVQTVVDGALSAMFTLVPYALARLPEQFELDDFLRQLLALSYLGEQRVAEPTKVEGLLAGERDYYRRVYADILAVYGSEHGQPQHSDGVFVRGPVRPQQQRRTERFLRRSRRRGVLRWPKYVLTVDDWLGIQLEKLERYHGVRLELTERQRRHPLIFGWPKFFELRRKGIVK